MPRKLISIMALVLVLAACTPREIARWHIWHEKEPAAAEFFVRCIKNHPAAEDHDGYWRQVCLRRAENVADRPDPVYALSGMSSCGQWADEAWRAGWRSEGSTLGTIMYRESRCQSGAHNPSGATGLMQIMPLHLGHTCPNGNLYDPVFNLHCALLVRQAAGWDAWSTF